MFASANGKNRRQPKSINWSYRKRGHIHRTQMNPNRNTNTFARKIATCAMPPGNVVAVWSRPKHGSVQPPKNSVTIIADARIMFAYSPMKNSANLMELYSML